jgi:F-type H+-transporting ATPase subunit gamma
MAASLRELRRKVRTVQHIRQITRAMKMVATAKLQRIQQVVQNGRRYQDQLRRLLAHVVAAARGVDHPYLRAREVQRVGVMIVGGDRGLCGAFNRQIMELALGFISSREVAVEVITVGSRMRRYAAWSGLEIVGSYDGVERPDDVQLARIVDQVRGWYESGQIDLVEAVYARFETIVRHPATSEQLLPLAAEAVGARTPEYVEYIFEPEAAKLLGELLPRAVEAEITQILLGTQASAQAARITAMSAATDNAEDMIVELTRQLNRARQEEIAAELLDVVSGARALQA